MVIVLNEAGDLSLEVAGQIIVLQEDAVLECLVPAFNLALCLRMIGGAAYMAHLLAFQEVSQFLSHTSSSVAWDNRQA